MGLIADQSNRESVKCRTVIKATIVQIGKSSLSQSLYRTIEEDQRHPGQFPLGGWKVGASSESLAIDGTATWTCQFWAKQ